MFNDSKFKILGMKTMKYILLVICVACASTMKAVDYKLHQTSSSAVKSISTAGNLSTSEKAMSSHVYHMSSYGMTSAPMARFQSTSAMPCVGSSLPQAAVSGTTTTDPLSNSTISGPRRIGGGNSGGGDGPTNPDDPWKTPLGDAVLPLLLLAAGYAIYLRRKNSVRTSDSGHQ